MRFRSRISFGSSSRFKTNNCKKKSCPWKRKAVLGQKKAVLEKRKAVLGKKKAVLWKKKKLPNEKKNLVFEHIGTNKNIFFFSKDSFSFFKDSFFFSKDSFSFFHDSFFFGECCPWNPGLFIGFFMKIWEPLWPQNRIFRNFTTRLRVSQLTSPPEVPGLELWSASFERVVSLKFEKSYMSGYFVFVSEFWVCFFLAWCLYFTKNFYLFCF